MIKTAGSERSWQDPASSHLLYFTEKMKELMKAAFSIISFHDYYNEVALEKEDNDPIWSLTGYRHYCAGHARCTPWRFFPRYLSKKEFLNP